MGLIQPWDIPMALSQSTLTTSTRTIGNFLSNHQLKLSWRGTIRIGAEARAISGLAVFGKATRIPAAKWAFPFSSLSIPDSKILVPERPIESRCICQPRKITRINNLTDSEIRSLASGVRHDADRPTPPKVSASLHRQVIGQYNHPHVTILDRLLRTLSYLASGQP